MAQEPRLLLILSDLHLSEGWDNDTGLLDRREDFFFGTWTRVFSENLEERLLKEESEFAYVQFDRGGRKTDLFRWRDDLNAGEHVRVFKPQRTKKEKE